MLGPEVLCLPGDTFAVKKIGVTAWQENFLCPVSDAEFWAFAERAYAAFDHFLAELEQADPEAADCLLADTAYLHQIIQLWHTSVITIRARAVNRHFEFGKPVLPDYSGHPNAGASALLLQARGRPLGMRLAVRLAKRAIFNRTAGLSNRLGVMAGGGEAWIIGSLTNLTRAYAETHCLSLDAPSIAELVGNLEKRVRDRDRLSAAFAYAINGIIDRIRAGTQEIDRSVQWGNVIEDWNARLGVLLSASRYLQKSRRHPRVAVVGESSKVWSKLVGLALKRKGAHLVGTNHGYYVGQMSSPGLAWHTHAPYDEIICYSPADAELLALDYRATSIGQRRAVAFNPLPGNSSFGALADRLAKQPAPRGPVRSVMLIGYPMTPQRYAWSAGGYFPMQLDAELRIAHALRKAGFRVIYKMHPDRQAEATGLFEGEVDEVIVTRFEEVWHQADAFVFGNIMTTVFNVAALTDRPIVALEVDGYRWMPGVRASCARRVRFVPASFDKTNRLHFDMSAIVAHLHAPPGPQDQDYAQRYLLRYAPASSAAA